MKNMPQISKEEYRAFLDRCLSCAVDVINASSMAQQYKMGEYSLSFLFAYIISSRALGVPDESIVKQAQDFMGSQELKQVQIHTMPKMKAPNA